MRHQVLLWIGLGFAAGWAWPTVGRGQQATSPRAEQLRFDQERGAWVELARPEPGTAEGELALARAAFASGDYKQTRRAIKQWIEIYGAESELLPQALLLGARADKALRNYYVAYETLTRVLDEYGGTPDATEAAVELFNVAEVYLSGVRRKVWGMRLLPAQDLALDILDDLAVRFPETSLAEQAIKTKADHFFKRGDFGLAEMEYSRLVQTFPQSRYVRYGLRRSADSALAGFGGIRFDDAPLIEAEERYRQYVRQYRGLAEQESIGLILEDIRERRAAKEFSIGAYYQKTGQPRAAAFYYRSTITHWPQTIASRKATQALDRMGQAVEANAGAMSDASTVGGEG